GDWSSDVCSSDLRAPELCGALLLLALAGVDVLADIILADLRPSAAPAALVLRLEHLIDVVHLELDLVLVRPRGLPVEDVRARARIPLPDRQEDPEDQQTYEHHPDTEQGIVDSPIVARIGTWRGHATL